MNSRNSGKITTHLSAAIRKGFTAVCRSKKKKQMERTNLHQSILLKRQKLNEGSLLLKKEFIGLDEIVSEVINLITPWYLFPDAQMRPTVINLWGLTGSGKTALVNRLVDLLDH